MARSVIRYRLGSPITLRTGGVAGVAADLAAEEAARIAADAAMQTAVDACVQGRSSLTTVGRVVGVAAAGIAGMLNLAVSLTGGVLTIAGTLSTARQLTLPDQNVAVSPYGASLIDDATAADARTTLGLGSIATAAAGDYLAIPGGTLTGSLTTTGTVTAIAAATQDAVRLAGRAGGTGSYIATITPTTLSASRTITIPNLDGTLALTGASQNVTFGTLSSTALTSTGGVAVGGALTGATTGAFSSTVTTGRLTASGTDAGSVSASQATIGGGVGRFANAVHAGATLTTTTATSVELDIQDNTSAVFKVKQSSNNYIRVSTTNGSETVVLGNTTTKPDIILDGDSTSLVILSSGVPLRLGNAAVAGTPTPTHTITIQDLNGTTYRVPCVV